MASFCHDSYEHPLLWCDDKRRAVERVEAKHSIAVVKQRKEAAQFKKIKDQNEVGKVRYCVFYSFYHNNSFCAYTASFYVALDRPT